MAEQTLKLHNDTQSVNGSAILGKLTGPCADIINPTRNGRKYTEALWDKTFKNPIVQEYFDCGGIFGELGHPADRSETDMEKIAICMPQPPVKDSKTGQLIGTWDILDTPNGRIAYALAKYGYKLGISSRGTGDVYTDTDGSEVVDEDTYDFQAFDLVLLPAVKTARLSVTESLTKGFKHTITESLAKASVDDRKIMMETLNNLNIDYSQSNKTVNNIDVADNDGISTMKQLQESLHKNKQLERQVANLKAQLSVGNTKVTRYEERIAQYKHSITNLTEAVRKSKAVETKYGRLLERYESSQAHTDKQDNKIAVLQEQLQSARMSDRELSESLRCKDDYIAQLEQENEVLRQQLKHSQDDSKDRQQALQEDLTRLKNRSNGLQEELGKKLKQSTKLVEKYKGVAKTAVNKYIESQAVRLGVDSNEVKNKLPENYSFDDIDTVCESLQDYNVSISNLPFRLDSRLGSKPKMKITESKETILPTGNFDDSVDDQLMNLANLN